MLHAAIILAALCYFDLLSTIILINLNVAVESGPVLRAYCQAWGIPGLIGGKITIVALGFFVIEAAWRTEAISKDKASNYYWASVVAFCLTYSVLFLKGNAMLP